MTGLIRKLAEFIFLTYARSRRREEMIDVRDHLSQIVTALVIAPDRLPEFRTAVRLLGELQQIFGETHFTVLMKQAYSSQVATGENLQMITYAPEQIAFYGLPKKGLREIIRARHFDMVIDLNYDFDLVSTCLCMVSRAKMLVCLQNPKRDNLYTFQVRASGDHSVDLKYESLIKYLSAFKPLSNAPVRDLMTA